MRKFNKENKNNKVLNIILNIINQSNLFLNFNIINIFIFK